jgi:hypothetical protein
MAAGVADHIWTAEEIVTLAAQERRILSVSEYPSYVPSWFAMGRFRRWGARDPRRVIAWFGGVSLVLACVVIASAIAGDILFLIAGGIVLADLVIEGAIFLPRAWRASRDDLPTSN